MTRGPIVIKIGGRALDEPSHNTPLWDGIASLIAAGRSHPAHGGVLLVHGGGSAVDTHLGRLGMTSERRAGLRVTPNEQIAEVVAVLRGTVNTRVAGILCARGVSAVGLGLSDGGACVCEQHTPDGIDLGRVGVVTDLPAHGSDAPGAFWRQLIANGRVPVLCSIGLDAAGEPLNVNADDAAAAVARLLDASLLVLLTDVPGIMDSEGSVIPETDHAHIESLISDGTIAGGMIPKARAAVAAAQASGVPALIASWREPERLPLLADGGTPGTRVMPGARRLAGTNT